MVHAHVKKHIRTCPSCFFCQVYLISTVSIINTAKTALHLSSWQTCFILTSLENIHIQPFCNYYIKTICTQTPPQQLGSHWMNE